MLQRTPEYPISPQAARARQFALFALLVAVIGVIFVRVGLIEIVEGLAVTGFALFFALLSLMYSGIAVTAIWQNGQRGIGSVVFSGILCLGIYAWPLFLAVQAYRLPQLRDISTDVADPPEFSSTPAAMAARGNYVPPQVAPEARAPQRRAYPQVQPILIDLDMPQACQLVEKAVQAMRWKTMEWVTYPLPAPPQAQPAKPVQGRRASPPPPAPPVVTGCRLDATDRTGLMGLVEDVTVRLRRSGGQTRIDVRSASRFGPHDLGSNARRILAFAQEIQTQLDLR